MSAIQKNVEQTSKSYSASFTQGHLALPPAKKYLVLTCMDARIDPARAFGIELGDAHVIRNAGASAVDALRSIVISEQLLGTNEIILVKHTGCGMLTFKNEDAYGVVGKNLGQNEKADSKGLASASYHTTVVVVKEGDREEKKVREERGLTCDNNNQNREEALAELKAKKLDFLPFPELEKAVEDDVAFLKGSKLVPESVTISGWVYEVESGETRRVV
ncbi:carbonic anhydrase [Triangularia setosa]|uniref:Carbonic anhydrase n=1 Tax=Triangularia setosa TaxID=2587417 RepID=A0AAN6W4W0_9PEZI|nr:carbonic anhydrase [Podospora setosa]